MGIISFKDKERETLYSTGKTRSFSSVKDVARKKLMLLDAAVDLNDLRALPGNRLELLELRHAGVYSIRINKQWRICFTWTSKGAEDVRIMDYH